MTKSAVKKSLPAGKEDKITITYTQFASNLEKTEIKTGEGNEFDNDALLEMLGFEKDADGVLKLQASEHSFEIAPNGEIIRKEKGKTSDSKEAYDER